MKITDVRTAEIKGHGYSTYVRIYTDEGVIGNGECIHGGEGCPEMVHALKQEIIGESPLNVDMLFEKMRRGKLFDGAMAGATVTAMTGIEIALWDLAGKGSACRSTSSSAASSATPSASTATATRARTSRPPPTRSGRGRWSPSASTRQFDVDAAGFRNDPLELACLNAELDWMVERVAAVREAVGPAVDLAIDMHGRYDIASGIAVARAMEPFGLLWLEEPVPPENVAAMREVKRVSPVPLCSGETSTCAGASATCWSSRRSTTSCPTSPSAAVCRSAARSRTWPRSTTFRWRRTTSRTARHHGLGLSRLDPQLPGHGVALDRLPGWDDLTLQDQPVIQNGHVVLTDKPGIGLEVNDEVARTFVRPGTEYLASAPSRARSVVVAADTGTRRVIVVKEHSLVTMARGAVLRAFNEPLTLEEAPVLDPEPGALIARIEMGICGTDVHLHHGNLPIPTPVISAMRRSAASRRLARGSRPTSTASRCGRETPSPGRPISPAAVATGVWWRRSARSAKAARSTGSTSDSIRAPRLSGGWAEFIYLQPGSAVFKLPAGISPLQAIALGCAGPTAVHGVLEIVGIGVGETVVVQGAVRLGWRRRCTPNRGRGQDDPGRRSASRLDLARQIGVGDVHIDIFATSDPAERQRQVLAETPGGRGADVVLECAACRARCGRVRSGPPQRSLPGARAVHRSGAVPINPHVITRKQLKVYGSWAFAEAHYARYVATSAAARRALRSQPVGDPLSLGRGEPGAGRNGERLGDEGGAGAGRHDGRIAGSWQHHPGEEIMRVLVTGGNGRLGKWAARELRDHGHEVVSVDRSPPTPSQASTFARWR